MVNLGGKTLTIGDREIEFSAIVSQVIEIKSLKVVRVYPSDYELDSYPQNLLNKNIYCYNNKGDFVWQISEAPHGGENEDKAYMNIWVDDNQLIAGNWNGLEYIVELKNGEVRSLKKGVRPW